MRKLEELNKKVMWTRDIVPPIIKAGYLSLPSGIRVQVIVGFAENGWEHVSVKLLARRLPTWDEMQYIKEVFWEDEEEVVQMHPKKSQYVNIAEALHLWRPVDGDWNLIKKG